MGFKEIDAFFEWFAALFCYMSFIVLHGGTNSAAMQQQGS